jgi:hypothetical protein
MKLKMALMGRKFEGIMMKEKLQAPFAGFKTQDFKQMLPKLVLP